MQVLALKGATHMAKTKKSTEKKIVKKKIEKVEGGLVGLSEAFKHLKLEVPKLGDLSGAFKDMDAEIEARSEGVQQINDGMTNALKWLADAQKWIGGHIDRKKRKMAAEKVAAKKQTAEEYVETCFSHKDDFFRSAAAMAYLRHAFSRTFETREDASAMLTDLEARKVLVKTGNDGPIMVGYQHYLVDKDFGIDREDLAEITGAIAKFSRQLMQLVYQQRQERAKEMAEEADIELADVMKGKNGKCLVEVPAESYIDRENHEKWRGGGSLLAEFCDRDVIPISGVGSIENAVKAMVEADVRIQRYTLAWNMPPATGNAAFEKVLGGVRDSMGLSEQEAERYINQMKAFWWLIRRAVRVLRDKEAIEKLKEEFHQKADITALQLFGFNGSGNTSNGTACLEFQGTFHNKANKPALTNLIFLATRGEDGGEAVIEVTEVPEHLKEVLGVFVGKKFPMKDNFSNCPAQLGRILRGIRGQLDLTAEIAKE